MIRLATVFSGIGAIEHALDRMGIEHEIVFACDNGDVEILTKKIGLNIDEIKTEIALLDTMIQKLNINNDVDDLYKQQLFGMFHEMNAEYHVLDEQLAMIRENSTGVQQVMQIIIENSHVKKARVKEYSRFSEELFVGTKKQQLLKTLQVILEITNDFKKDNQLGDLGKEIDFESTDGILWCSVSVQLKALYDYLEEYNGKKIIRRAQDLSQRAGQLHEKINYLKVQKELDDLGEDWTARKQYVDHLYEGLEKRNKVKQSYMANYKLSNEHFHWNVAFLNGRQYQNNVDLFVGGSPCQSFSLVGKQRGLDDTRGTLFYEYARLIDEIKPKIFIYENVRAVLSHDGGKTWEKMQQVFDELGYKIYPDVMNAKNYGIPQNRERIFVVGFRDDIAPQEGFEFPPMKPLERTMKEFLIDHAPGGYFLPKKGVEFVTNEKNLRKRFTQIDGEIQLCQEKESAV